jgi:SAM-dependent methyltransferase
MSLDPRATATGLSSRLKRRLTKVAKETAGRFLLPFRPDLRRKIEAQGLERYSGHFREVPLAERLVLAALLARQNASGAQSTIVDAHRRYWASPDAAPYTSLESRISHVSAGGKHYPLIEALDQIVAAGGYHTLCEIGCGSGLVLDHLGRRWPNLRELVGLDLSAEQVARNRQHFSDPRLRFDAADATAWIPSQAQAGTIFLTYDGVLEYFTEPALEAVLFSLAARPPICFALVEPIASDYDLDREERSRLFGGEMSFSHNYPHAFVKAGFRIRWQQEIPGRYMMMIATAGDDNAHAITTAANLETNDAAMQPTRN